MPHLTVEYTTNLALDAGALLLAAPLATSGHFDQVDIKSRAYRLQEWRVGTGDTARGPVHTVLALLSVRTDAVKSQLSNLVLELLRQHVPPSCVATQLCVSIEEIHGPAYVKATVEPSSSQHP